MYGRNSVDKVSGKSSYSYQSSWVSRWTQTASKQGSLINPHSSVFGCEPDIQHIRQKHIHIGMSSEAPKFCSDGRNKFEAQSVGLLRERGKNLVVEKSDYDSFRSCSLSTDKRKAVQCPQTDQKCENEMTAFLGSGNSSVGRENDLPHTSGFFPTSDLPLDGKGLAPLKFSGGNVSSLAASGENPSKFGVFGRHIPGNTFTGLDRGANKIENFSAMPVRGKEIDHPSNHAIKQKNNWGFLQRDIHPTNSFKPYLAKNQNQCLNMQEDSDKELSRRNCPPPRSYFGKPLEVSNVETMRICTRFDSVESSQGGYPTYSHMTHQFLFTKQTGCNMPRQEIFQEAKRSARQNQGVTIQPLWSSTDDSEEKDGSAARNEASADTKTADVGGCGNWNDNSGVASSELNAGTPRRKIVVETSASSDRAKEWSKLPNIKTSNINKELLGLRCELRLGKGSEATTSQQTQTLEAEHLCSDTEDSPTRSKSCRPRKLIPLLEPSSRCVKRLKTSSSKSLELGILKGSNIEASSLHEEPTNLNLFRGSSQNVESSDSNKKNQNTLLPWIQRLRVNPSVVTAQGKSQAVVICEPNTSKMGFEELGRKQFPSIGAMALMGKSMNGLRPCELTKKGPLVVWNTKS